MTSVYPKSREQWLKALESLPEVKSGEGKIPAVFFGHGRKDACMTDKDHSS